MSVFSRLIRDLEPYWKTLLLAIVLTFATAGIQLVPPLFYRSIIDGALSTHDVQQLVSLVVSLVGVYLASSLLNGVDQYIRAFRDGELAFPRVKMRSGRSLLI